MGQARAQTRGSVCGGLSNEPIAHYFGGVCYIYGAGTRSDPRQRLRGRSNEPIAGRLKEVEGIECCGAYRSIKAPSIKASFIKAPSLKFERGGGDRVLWPLQVY